jgi:hypothetical protein
MKKSILDQFAANAIDALVAVTGGDGSGSKPKGIKQKERQASHQGPVLSLGAHLIAGIPERMRGSP